MGCCAGGKNQEAQKDPRQTTAQTQAGENANKKKLSSQQAEQRRMKLQNDLAEGRSYPPVVAYPKMPPISTVYS